MDAHKAKITELEAKIAELKAGRDADGADHLAIAREVLALDKLLKVEVAAVADIEASNAILDSGDGDEGDAGEGEGEGDTPAEGDAPVEVDAPAEVPAEAPAPVQALAASASSELSPTATATTGPVATLTASASMGGVHGGATLDREGLRKILASTLTAGGGAGGGRILEVNRWGADAVAVSEANSVIGNTRIIREAQRKHKAGEKSGSLALTAAACFCGPDEILEDLGLTGDRGRPIASLFPSVPVNGGFSFFRDLTIDPDSTSVGVWTCTDQDAVDPDDDTTWKTCPELDCFTQESCFPYMIKACTTVQRTHKWAHPEQIDTWIEKLRLEYDRAAEKQLLSIIEAEALNTLEVGSASMAAYGYLAQIVYALGSLSYAMGYQFRESDALDKHVVVIPNGSLNAILADELIRGFPNNIRTKRELESYIENAFGVRLVERLDEPTGALSTQGAATVTALNAGGNIDAVGTPLLPPQFRLYILRPDQWVHGEGEMVGADWYVDNAMLRQNKLQYFWENVESLCFTGVEKPYIVDVNACIRGTYADLSTPPVC